MANSEQPVLTPHELAALDLAIGQAQLEGFQAVEAPSWVTATGGLVAASGALTVIVTMAAVMGGDKSEANQTKLRRQIADAFAEFERENGVPEPSLDELIALRQRLSR